MPAFAPIHPLHLLPLLLCPSYADRAVVAERTSRVVAHAGRLFGEVEDDAGGRPQGKVSAAMAAVARSSDPVARGSPLMAESGRAASRWAELAGERWEAREGVALRIRQIEARGNPIQW